MDQAKGGKPRWLETGLSFALLLLVVGTFQPVLRNGFINYDDDVYVTDNFRVRQGLNWTGVEWAFSTGAAANWHPVTWLAHMLDCSIYGLRPWGHHLTNLLLHSANTLLLFLVFTWMTGAPWRGFFVAAIFGVHPLHVESVVWVSERKDVLSGFFFLLTIWSYAQYARLVDSRNLLVAAENNPNERRKERVLPVWTIGSYLLTLALFALGLMSKSMLVTTPFVLLLLDYWPLQRWRKASALRLLAEKVPFLALAAVAATITYLVQRRAGTMWEVSTLPLSVRIGNALVAYSRYLGKAICPSGLAIFYPHPGDWPAVTVVLAGLLVSAITAAALLLRKRSPYFFVGWCWFVGTLVPVIGLVQVGWQALANRYMYIPLIGLSLPIVWAVAEVPGAGQGARGRAALSALSASGVALIVVCALLTRHEIAYWLDSETLFRRSLAVTPDNWLAEHNLASALLSSGHADEAIAHFRDALRLRPTSAESCVGLGEALLNEGRLNEAAQSFELALTLKPDSATLHNQLGLLRTRQGAFKEAVGEFEQAVKVKPDYAKAYSNLGMALQAQGRLDEAIAQLEIAVRRAPNDAEAHNNLGMALGRKGRLDEAIGQLEQAIKLQPGNPQAHHNLGLALMRKDRLDEALEHFEQALALNPGSAETHAAIGSVLSRKGRREEAIAHLREALRLKPGYAQAEQLLRELNQ